MNSVLFFFNVTYSIIFVFLAVGLCIFVHELGHFFVARWRKLHVIAFSIGFKKIWGFKYKGVEYRIGCIPFGGYVELPQIDATGEPKDENGNPLPKAKPIDKILTAFAGPFCNILLGAAFASIIWLTGFPSVSPKMSSIEVAHVEPNSPEYNAGLRPGDVIEKFNGKSFHCSWREFVEKILFNIGPVELEVNRNGERILVSYTPIENEARFPGEKIPYPFFEPKIPVVVKPLKKSPAEKAGLKENDIIIAVNGEKIQSADEFIKFLDINKEKPLKLSILRKGKVMEFSNIIPEKSDEQSQFRIGIQYEPDLPLKVNKILPESPALKAGLQVGDIILELNGKTLTSPEELYNAIQQNKSNPLTLKISRNGEIINLENIIPAIYNNYQIGVAFVYTEYPTPLQLFNETIEKTYKTLRGIFSKKNKLKARNLSGVVGIVHHVGKIVFIGNILAAIYFLAFISYSLAIVNLLPLPVLDGGHIFISILEIVLGKPLPEKMLKPIYTAFIAILIALMLFVTYHDILRLIKDFSLKKESKR